MNRREAALKFLAILDKHRDVFEAELGDIVPADPATMRATGKAGVQATLEALTAAAAAPGFDDSDDSVIIESEDPS